MLHSSNTGIVGVGKCAHLFVRLAVELTLCFAPAMLLFFCLFLFHFFFPLALMQTLPYQSLEFFSTANHGLTHFSCETPVQAT